MIILASITISTISRNEGIIKNSKKAKDEHEIGILKEKIELMLVRYGSSTQNEEITQYLNKKIDEKEIDSFKIIPINGEMRIAVEKEGKFFLLKEDNGLYSVEDVLDESNDFWVKVVSSDNFSKENGTLVKN